MSFGVSGGGSSSGSASNSFALIQPITGTSPTAHTSTDTLTLNSPQGTVAITGNSTTDVISFDVLQGENPRYRKEIMEDWDSWTTSGTWAWSTVTSGGALGSDSTMLDANHPGILKLSTGTTATGYSGHIMNPNQLTFGAATVTCEYLVYHYFLSNGTDTYQTRIGFGNQSAATLPTNGAYFVYDSTTSANWQCVCVAASTKTQVTTTVAVKAKTTRDATFWQRLTVVANAAGTQVDFYIDGTNVATITTNVPTGNNNFGMNHMIQKSAGTSNSFVFIDYTYLKMAFTTPR